MQTKKDDWKKIKNDIIHILKNFFLFADLPMKVKSLLVINPEIPTFPLDHRQSWLKKFFVVNEFSLGVSQPPHLKLVRFFFFLKKNLVFNSKYSFGELEWCWKYYKYREIFKKPDFHSVYHNAAIYYRVKPVFFGIIHWM